MPKKAGMESWKKKRRQEYMEMKEHRYYIFCEGQQTEPRYFEGFNDQGESEVGDSICEEDYERWRKENTDRNRTRNKSV